MRSSAIRLTVVSLSLLCALAMAGCTGIPWPLWNATDAPVESVRLSVWLPSSHDGQSLNESHIADFVAARGGVSMTVTLLDTSVAPLDALLVGDVTPDLVEVDLFRLPALVNEGVVSPFAAEWADVSGISPALVEAATIDGVLYCLPKEIQTLGLYYNKTLFDDANISYPAAGWTWTDLRRAAEAISGLPTVRFSAYGLVLGADPSRWLPFYLQAGGEWQRDAPLNPDALTESLDYYTGLLATGLAIDPGYYGSSWSGPIFGNGRVGMVIEGNWLSSYLDTAFPDLPYGVAPLPAGPAGSATLAFGACYAVPAASAEQASAFALAARLASPTAMQDRLAVSAAIPAREKAAVGWEARYPALRAHRTQLIDARIWQGLPANVETPNELQRLIEEAIADVPTEEDEALAPPPFP